MPTLDDAPTVEKLLGTTTLALTNSDSKNELNKEDILQIYDASEQKTKAITVDNFARSLYGSALA